MNEISKCSIIYTYILVILLCALLPLNSFITSRVFRSRNVGTAIFTTLIDGNPSRLDSKGKLNEIASKIVEYEGAHDWEEGMEGFEGFDWHLEQARRLLEGPGFAPLRMTLWQPILQDPKTKKKPPGFFDSSKILLNNAFQILGLAESIDGAPLVQGVNTFKGSPLQLLSRVLDGNLQELAGGPLFLLLHDYYKIYGPVYKLAFGPKSFIVVSDPVMVKHILKVNWSLLHC